MAMLSQPLARLKGGKVFRRLLPSSKGLSGRIRAIGDFSKFIKKYSVRISPLKEELNIFERHDELEKLGHMKDISVMHNKGAVRWQYAESYAEELVFLPSRKEKVVLFSMKLQVPLRKGQSLSRCKFSLPIADGLQRARSGAIDGKLSGLCHIVMECISNHQKVMPSNLPKAVILANSLLLILPLRVLAETCEARNPFIEMPLLFAIALIGATVGGLLARQRRGELERLNDQLRQINAALRRQAKIESYAPSLSYAPVGRILESEVIVDPRKQQLITILRTGKKFLRNQDIEKASVEFKAAFDLAQSLGDPLEEKKAARGLGASLQRLGKYRESIKYYSKILEISRREGEDSGSTEAYGAIADCYAELGELERAAKFYDKYIARLESD